MPRIAWILFRQLTPIQLAAVRDVHVLVYSGHLRSREGGTYLSDTFLAEWAYIRTPPSHPGFQRQSDNIGPSHSSGGPRSQTMTITMILSSWQLFKANTRLVTSMLENEHWENVFGGLNELKMQLEIEWSERDKLQKIIARFKGVVWNIGRGQELAPTGTLKEDDWMGTKYQAVGGSFLPQEEGQPSPLCSVRYWTGTLMWKVRAVQKLVN